MIKKLLYSFVVIAGLVSCNDDYTDWASPQSNTSKEVAEKFAFTVEPSVTSIDFAVETAENIQLFTTNLQEGQTNEYAVTFSAEGKTETASLTATEGGKVASADLQAAVAAIYGKAPEERTFAVEVMANVKVTTEDGAVMTEKKGAPFTLKAKLVAPRIESAYYFIGATNGWKEGDTSLKFKHSDTNVYDDPVFTIVVEAPYKKKVNGEFELDDDGNKIRVDQWFNIIPESALAEDADFWASLIGSDTKNGDDRKEAGLAYKVDGADNAFMQPASDGAKFYSITLNMMDYKMTVAPLSFEEFVYVPGDHQQITKTWEPENAPALQSPNYDGIYTGFSYLDGDFKFTKARNWGAEYNYNDFSTYSDGLSQGGGSNIKTSDAGFYKVEADIVTGKLTVTATTWGIVGSATTADWDAPSALDMTWNASDESWSITTELEAGKLKFVANKSWDINMGGSVDDLSQNGSDLDIAEAGNYTIKLFLTRCASNKIYCTITKN